MGMFRKIARRAKKILRNIHPSQLFRPLVVPKIKKQISKQLNRALEDAKILLTQQKEKDLQAVKELIDSKIHEWNLEMVELEIQLAESKITNEQLNQAMVWIILASLDCKYGTDEYLSELFDSNDSDVVASEFIIKKCAIEFLFTSELCPLQVAYENLSSHHQLEAIAQILPFYCHAGFYLSEVNKVYYKKIQSLVENRIGESLAITEGTYSEYDYMLAGLTELNEEQLSKWKGKCNFELMSNPPNHIDSEQIANGQLVVYEKNEGIWYIHYPTDLPAYPVFLQHARAFPQPKGLATGIYLYRKSNSSSCYALVVHPAIYNRYEILNLTASGISIQNIVFPQGSNTHYDADPAFVNQIMDACKWRYFEHRHLKLEQASDFDTALSATLKQANRVRILNENIPSTVLEITNQLISKYVVLEANKTSSCFGQSISYGESLVPGQYLVDDNALFRFVVEPNGRGMVYERLPDNRARILFSSPAIDRGRTWRFSITHDGNIEISDEARSWKSQWPDISCKPETCIMQGDGHLVVYGTQNQQRIPLYRSCVSYPLLHSFAKFGDSFIENIKNIIARDVRSVNSADFRGHLALDYALAFGYVETAKCIMSHGGTSGKLPLQQSRHVLMLADDAVCILVNDCLITGFNLETNKWVDVIKVNDEHDSKLQHDDSFSVQSIFVNENQFKKIKKYLIDNESDLETKLCDAVRANQMQACHLFILLGADVNAPYAAFKTPLMLAISETNNPALVRLLLQGKADCRLKTRDAQQMTAWHFAFAAFNQFSSSTTAIEIIEIMSTFDDESITDLKNAAGKSPQEMVAINAVTMPMRLALRGTLPDLNHDKCFELPVEYFRQKMPDWNASELTTPQWWQSLLHYLEIQKGMGQNHLCMQVGGCVVYFMSALPNELKDYYGHYIVVEGQKQIFYVASAEGHEIAEPVTAGDFDKLLQDIRNKQLPAVTRMVPLTYAQQASIFSGINQHFRSTRPTNGSTLLSNFYKIYTLIPAFNKDSTFDGQRLNDLLNDLIEGHAACTTGYHTRVSAALERACNTSPRNIQELVYVYRKNFVEDTYRTAATTFIPVEHRPTNTIFEIHDQGLFWSFAALGLSVPGTVTGENALIHRFFYKRNAAKILLDSLHEKFRPWSLANALTSLFKEGFENYTGFQGIRKSDLNKFQCYLMQADTPDNEPSNGSLYFYRNDKEIHALVTHLDGRVEVIQIASKADYFRTLFDNLSNGDSTEAIAVQLENEALEAIAEQCKCYYDAGEQELFFKRFVAKFMWLFPGRQPDDADVRQQLYGVDMEDVDDTNRIFTIDEGLKIRDINWHYIAHLMLRYLIDNDYFDRTGKPFIRINYGHATFQARHVDDVVDYYVNGYVSATEQDVFLKACINALPDKEELLGKLLLASIARHDVELRVLLITHGANINFAKPFNKAPALSVESYYQFLEKITYKLEQKITQPAPPQPKQTGPSQPVVDPYNEWVAKIKLQWFDERTPLMMAVTQGNITLIQDLLDAGADVNYQNTQGWTVLHEAAFLSRKNPEQAMDIMDVLFMHGADATMVAEAYGKPDGHKTILPIHLTWPETETFEYLILNTVPAAPGAASVARFADSESLPAPRPKQISIPHQNAILPYLVLAARLSRGNNNFQSAIQLAKACHTSFTTRLPRAFYHRQIFEDQPINNPSSKRPGIYFYRDNITDKTWILIVHDRARFEIHESDTLVGIGNDPIGQDELCSDENATTILSNCHYPFSMQLNMNGKLATTLLQLLNHTLLIFSKETIFYSDIPLQDRLASKKYRECFQLAAGYIKSISGIPNRWRIAVLTAFQVMSREAFDTGYFATPEQLSHFHREAVSCVGEEFSSPAVQAILKQQIDHCMKNIIQARHVSESIYQQIESQYQQIYLQVQTSLQAQFAQAKNKAIKKACKNIDIAVCGIAITALLAPALSAAIVANLGIGAETAAVAGAVTTGAASSGVVSGVNLAVVAIEALSTAVIGGASQALLSGHFKQLPGNIAKDFALNFVPVAASSKITLDTHKIWSLKAGIREGMRAILEKDHHILPSALVGGFGGAFSEQLSQIIRPELMKVFNNEVIVTAFMNALTSSLQNVAVNVARRRKLSLQDALMDAMTSAFQTFLGECIVKNIVIVADPISDEKKLDQVDAGVRRHGIVCERHSANEPGETLPSQSSRKKCVKTEPVVFADVEYGAPGDAFEKPGKQEKTTTIKSIPHGRSTVQHFFDTYDKGNKNVTMLLPNRLEDTFGRLVSNLYCGLKSHGMEYPGAILNGIVSGLYNTAAMIMHPVDNVLYPVSELAYDAAIIMANHTPPNALEPDFAVFQHYLNSNPDVYHNALSRMEGRIDNVKRAGVQFMRGTGPERAEMLSEMATGVLVPGYLFKGIKYVSATACNGVTNKMRFGTFSQPPYFNNLYPHEVTIPSFKTLTCAEIQNQAGTNVHIWVITTDNKLLIAPRQIVSNARQSGLILPNRFNMTFVHHHHLATLKPVLAAGELTTEGSAIKCITDYSGHYLPAGAHLPELVERNFKQFGFKDARGKYQPFVPIPGLTPVGKPHITYPRKPVAFKKAPGPGGGAAASIGFFSGSGTTRSPDTSIKQNLPASSFGLAKKVVKASHPLFKQR